MTTRYTSENRVAGWQYTQDLDAREALQRIAADKARSFTTKRFVGESLTAYRLRVGLTVSQVFRGNRKPVLTVNCPALLACCLVVAFWALVALLFCASLPL